LGLLPGLRGDSYTYPSASRTYTEGNVEQNKEDCSLIRVSITSSR